VEDSRWNSPRSNHFGDYCITLGLGTLGLLNKFYGIETCYLNDAISIPVFLSALRIIFSWSADRDLREMPVFTLCATVLAGAVFEGISVIGVKGTFDPLDFLAYFSGYISWAILMQSY
jgi:hypothetical protein